MAILFSSRWATWLVFTTALTQSIVYSTPTTPFLNPHILPQNPIGSKGRASQTLLPLVYSPLPLGSIHPTSGSWLENELHLSATGLAGHLPDFYQYVKDSSWLGGSAEYSDLNEGFPYAFNGLVGLAYSLSDNDSSAAALRSTVASMAGYVLDHQADDGWLGPEQGNARLLWGRFPFFLGLTQLVDADPDTWEAPVLLALSKFMDLLSTMLEDGGRGFVHQDGDTVDAGEYTWGQVRVADLVVTLQWLLEKHPSQQDESIWSSMEQLYRLNPLKWEDWYNEAVYIKDDLYDVPLDITSALYSYEHGVNVGQGLKNPAVVRRFTHNESLVQTATDAVDWTFAYHGAASGTVLADERIDGLSPYSGSELCTAVETLYSLSYLYQSLGTNNFADRAELAAFNALPVMLTGDHWAHQYMTQPNQPFSKTLSASPFFNANNQAQTYGLEPHYPCCTVNHPQGLPRYVSGSWVSVDDGGVAHVLLGPSTVQSNGVTIECDTLYPFGDGLKYTVSADDPLDFYIRIPDWATGDESLIQVEGDPLQTIANPAPGLQKVASIQGSKSISFQLNPKIRTVPRANDTIAVYRGALLYALEIGSKETSTLPKNYATQQEYPSSYAPAESRDYTMLNTSAWNIAIDPSTLVFHTTDNTSVPAQIYGSGNPPVYMTAQGCEITWPTFIGGVPGAVPPASERQCLGPVQMVTLRPYGSTKLHMAELPTIDLSSATSKVESRLKSRSGEYIR